MRCAGTGCSCAAAWAGGSARTTGAETASTPNMRAANVLIIDELPLECPLQGAPEPAVPPGLTTNRENHVPSLTRRVQSISRLPNAAGKRLGVEFPCLADIALRADGSPCRQDDRVVCLRQREQRRCAACLGGALEYDPGHADIALVQQQAGARHQAGRFRIVRRPWCLRRRRPRRDRRWPVARRCHRLVTRGQCGCRGFVSRRRRRRVSCTRPVCLDASAKVRRGVPARRQLLLELVGAGTFLRPQFLIIPLGRQLLLELLGAGPFLRHQLLVIPMCRQLPLELLGAGPFLRHQLLVILLGRQLPLELLGAGAFLRQQFPLIPVCRQLPLELLGAGPFLCQQLLVILLGRQLPLELLGAGAFLRQQFPLIPVCRQLPLELLGAGPFLCHQLLVIPARRQLPLELLGASPFLRHQLLVIPARRQLPLELLGAGPFLRQQFLIIPLGRQLLLELLGAGAFLCQQLLVILLGRQLLLELLSAGPFLRQQLLGCRRQPFRLQRLGRVLVWGRLVAQKV